MMPVAVVCGGLGTRLGALTAHIPKYLVPIHNEPFAFHQLRLLQAKGVHRVVLCIGHLGSMIEAFIGDGRRFGLEVAYSRDGDKPLGTAGAVAHALPLLGNRFFTLYGDSYLDCDYAGIESAFLQSGKAGLITVYRGVDYGLSVFHSAAFNDVTSGSLTQIHRHLQEQDELFIFEIDRPFQEAGSLAGIEELHGILG
jgi:NDP-sugar pyrophosphorylase family protein